MALPPQVQAAADAADATLAAINAANQAEAAASQPAEPEPAPVPEPPAAPVAPAQEPAKPDPWEQRYRSLQGVFDKEVPSLQQQVKSLRSELNAALEKLNAPPPAPPEPLVDPKDADSFGSDLVDMVSRVAQSAVARAGKTFEERAKALENEIARLNKQLTGVTETTAMTAEQTFFDRLGKLVPGWEKINSDNAFLAWLAEADPVYGVPRQNALNVAQQQLNAERAAAVFTAFIGPTKVGQATKTDPLDRMVSPKGAATVAPTPTQQEIITQAQVARFYDDLRRGAFRGKEADANRIESQINAALAEGRIR